MKTFVIAKQRILYDRIQEIGTEFEINADDLNRLMERDLVMLPSENVVPPGESSPQKENQPPVPQQVLPEQRIISYENSKASENNVFGQQRVTAHRHIGRHTTSATLAAQEQDIVKRKEAVFAGENKLLDREKELERRIRIMDRQEQDLALRQTKAEMDDPGIGSDNQKGETQLKRPFIRSVMQ
jgi:hypothetical protein